MKATVDGKSLQRGLELVAGALETRSTLPVLATVHMTARQTQPPLTAGMLQLYTTDLEQAIVVDVPADVTEPGERCVGGSKLIQVVKELAGAELRLSHDGKGSETGIQIRTTSGRWSINGFGAEDFPVLASLSDGDAIMVKAETLASALKSTAFAASHDEVRYVLNGLRLRVHGKQAWLAATDGHRLVELELPLEKGLEGDQRDVIIPSAAVRSLLTLLRGRQDAQLHLRGEIVNNLDVVVEGGRLSARLVEGVFPNTDAIFQGSQGRETIARLATADLVAALRQAFVMADERSHSTRMTFGATTLTLKSATGDQGEAEIELPITWQGKPAEVAIGVNARYVLDWLEFAPERITVAMKDATSPLLFNGQETEGGGKTAPAYVVMPLRI
jgi:DNA polymerase-3 subunit beta